MEEPGGSVRLSGLSTGTLYLESRCIWSAMGHIAGLYKRVMYLSGVSSSSYGACHSLAIPCSIITCLLFSLCPLWRDFLAWQQFSTISAWCPFAVSCECDCGAILEATGSTDRVWGDPPAEARQCSLLTLPDQPHQVSLLLSPQGQGVPSRAA